MYLMISTDELAGALERSGLLPSTGDGRTAGNRTVAAALRGTLERSGFVIVHHTDLRAKLQVGDLISRNATDIPIEVVRLVDAEMTNWERATGEDRYAIDDLTRERERDQPYDWVASGGGGWSTSRGLIDAYAPLTVTEVTS